MKSILEDGQVQMMAERNSTASPHDRRATMMAEMQDQVSKIKAVLTDDQKAKFDAMATRRADQITQATAPTR